MVCSQYSDTDAMRASVAREVRGEDFDVKAKNHHDPEEITKKLRDADT